MSYYKDPQKMLKRYAVMKTYQDVNSSSQYPIELAIADIFNKMGCECGVKYNPQDIEYSVNEIKSEDRSYVLIEAKTICSGCNRYNKLSQTVEGDELQAIKEQVGL